MFVKARDSQADGIILDLEDSVILSDKALARSNIANTVHIFDSEKRIIVRINERGHPDNTADLALIENIQHEKLTSVMLPKIHSIDDVDFWANRIPQHIEFEIQIESPLGLINSSEIASHSRVASLSFGSADFMASTGIPAKDPGIPESPYVLNYPLSKIVISGHAYQKNVYDGPYFRICDLSGLRDAARNSRDLGVNGKWAIHPAQIAICNEVFTPNTQEVDRAEKIISVFNASSGAATMDGVMIDEATKKIAENLLERAKGFRRSQ